MSIQINIPLCVVQTTSPSEMSLCAWNFVRNFEGLPLRILFYDPIEIQKLYIY